MNYRYFLDSILNNQLKVAVRPKFKYILPKEGTPDDQIVPIDYKNARESQTNILALPPRDQIKFHESPR